MAKLKTTTKAAKSGEQKANAKAPALKPIKATKEFVHNGKPFVMIMAGGSGTRLWPISRFGGSA